MPDPKAKLTEILSDEQRAELQRAARADGHTAMTASHLILRDDRIIGYGSIGNVAVINAWMDSKTAKAADSVRMLREAEERCRAMGFEYACLPVSEHSPFLPLVERLGYSNMGWASYNLKNLKA